MKRFCAVISVLLFFSAAVFAVPDAVTDLRIDDPSSGFRHIGLKWTTPYDASAGTAPACYQLRLSTFMPIVTEADWNNNSALTSYPYRIQWTTSNITAGQEQSRIVTGLANGQSYFFAIKTSTDNANWSAIDTSSPEPFKAPFNTAPGLVDGHNLMNGVITATSTPLLSWNPGAAGSDDANYDDYVCSYTVELSKYLDFSVKLVKDAITTNSWISYTLDENATYYWRVKAGDVENLYSSGYLSQSSRRFIVNAINDPPSAFSLTSPINSQIETVFNPVLQWASSGDTDPGDSITYTVWYSTVSNFSLDISTGIAGITVTQYQPVDNLTENATYYWKAYAVDSAGAATICASTGTFRINTANEPPLSFNQAGPSQGEVVLFSTPTLSWQQTTDPDPGDSFTYSVIYSSSDSILFLEYTSSNNLTSAQFIMPALVEDATYYWKVQAIDTSLSIVETPIRYFVVNSINNPPLPFDLVSSSGIVASSTPLFDWQNTSDPDGNGFSYTIYYSTMQDFSVFAASSGLTSSSYAPLTALAENTTYYWRVDAIDIYSAVRASNQSWKIMVNAVPEPPAGFNLAAPANSSKISCKDVFLDWQDTADPDPGDFVSDYTLFYSTYSDFIAENVISGITVSSYTIPVILENNATYYWKVKAVSAISGERLSNTTWQFLTSNLPPNPFNLVSSSGVAAVLNPLFDWADTTDPEGDSFSYTLYYSSYSDFSSYFSSAGLSVSQYLPSALEENRFYWWYVEAIDTCSNVQRSSQTWSLAINTSPQAPSSFGLLMPSDNSSLDTTTPGLDWQDSADPDPWETVSYELWYSTDPALSSKNIVSGISVSDYKFVSDLSTDTTYYWRVYAIGSDLLSTESQTWMFHVKRNVRLLAPSNFRVSVSSDNKSAVLSWDEVSTNDDGSAAANVPAYRIYKAYSFESLFTVSAATTTGAGILSWTDDNLDSQAIYYMVTAYDFLTTESLPSIVQKIGGENLAIIYTDDKTGTVSIPPGDVVSTITIEIVRIAGDENGNVLRSYSVRARDSNRNIIDYIFPSPATLSFELPAQAMAQSAFAQAQPPAKAGVFWNNGVEWVYLGGEKNQNEMSVKSLYLGLYQLRLVSRASEFKPLSIWPKIITPNNDAVNDNFNYTFENPAADKVEGEIFDLSGARVSRMDLVTDYWLSWDGKDEDEEPVSAGIYVYQVHCGTKIYNGTVVVAK